MGIIAMMGFLFCAQSVHADDTGWMTQAFAGSRVRAVQANPSNPQQVVAVVDGQLKITWDGGLIWRSTNLPAVANVIAFDPVHPGDVYAGTNTGVYRSTNIGLSWSPFGNASSQSLVVLGLAADKDGIFATENNGAGSSLNFFRFDRDGSTSWLAFPAATAGNLYVDKTNSYLYAANQSAIYRSIDAGNSWTAIGTAGQIGFNSLRVYAKGSEVWQLASGGVWHTSNQGLSWQVLANNTNVPDLNFSGMYGIGLAVNHGNAFFGVRQDSFHIYGAIEVGSGLVPAHLGYIAQAPLDMTVGDDSLWMGTENGLLVRRGLTVNEAGVQRPVVVVPGILGSWDFAGKWYIDPIFHTYDPLLNMLRSAGYEDNQTLFTFPYQWRQDNNISASQFADKLAEVRSRCLCNQVDVIGHSMGGLVARAYVEGSNYHNDIANLILLGTPNAGSLEDYSVWEAGVNMNQNWVIRSLFNIFNLEAYEHLYSNIRDYVHAYVTSVAQLLPSYSYISGRTYPVGYPVNAFLDDLNSSSKLTLLNQRTHVVIAGSDNKSTLVRLEVGPQSNKHDWPDGEIVNPIYGQGDDTVPLTSLISIGPRDFATDQTHGGLTTNPSSGLLAYLMNGSLQVATLAQPDKDVLMLYVKSPVKLSITDPNGNGVSDSVNQISQSFYTGSDVDVQFITIPGYATGTYHIHLTGKGSGRYTVGASVIGVNPSSDSTVEYQFHTNVGQEDELIYDSAAKHIQLASTSYRQSERSMLVSSTPTKEKPESTTEAALVKPELSVISTQASAVAGLGTQSSANQSHKKWPLLPLMLFSAMISGIWLIYRYKNKLQ